MNIQDEGIQEILNKLERARIFLAESHFFLGSIMLNLKTELTEEIPTASVDGYTYKFNPQFVSKLHNEELIFLYAHETMHVIFEHCIRIHGRDPEIWNIATDIVINELLINDYIGTFIQGGVHNPKLYKEGNGSADQIYSILANKKQNKEFNKILQDIGKGFDEVKEGKSPIPGTKEQERIKQMISSALAVSKMMGNQSGNIERLVAKSLYVPPTCLEVLINYLSKIKDDVRSFQRPNRRFISQGIYLPSTSGEKVGNIGVAIDCSGSITKKELAEFQGMIETLITLYNPKEIQVVYFDYSVQGKDVFTQDDVVKLQLRGGGGTSYKDIWNEFIDIDVCLIFTDLDCKDYGDKPSYPVVWVRTQNDKKAPWGIIVDFYPE